MEVIFSNIKPTNTTRRIAPPIKREPVQTYVPPNAAVAENYEPGIRYFCKDLNRYISDHEINALENLELKKLWNECREVADSFSPHLNPNRKATAELFAAMCKYTTWKRCS